MLHLFNKYLPHFHKLARNQATTDTATLYLSSLVSSGVGFISSVVVARTLGPTDFAIIAGYNAIVMTLAGFTDFGLGTGLIKYVTPHLKEGGEREKSYPYFRFMFISELVIGSLLLSLGLLFASFVPSLLGQTLTTNVVRLAVIAAAVTSTAAYIGAAMAAHKKFKLNAVISITMSVLKLGFIAVLWWVDSLSITNILFGYVFLSLLNAAIGFAVVPKDYLSKTQKEAFRKAGKNIIRFSGWLTLSFFITSIMGKLDFFYLYKLKGPTDAGVYAAAQQLSMIYSILVGAIGTVMTPYISEKIEYHDKISFLRRAIPIAIGIAGLFVLSTLLVPTVINLIFGSKYVLAIQPLKLLIVALAVNVILLPISLMYIPLGKVKYGPVVSGLELAFVLVAFPVLIGKWGSNGAALTILLASLIGLVIYSTILPRLLAKERKAL